MTTTGLQRSMGVGVAIGLILVRETALVACPVCFRIEEGPAADGVRAAVAVLMAVTGIVLSGAALFVVRFVRRAARLPASDR